MYATSNSRNSHYLICYGQEVLIPTLHLLGTIPGTSCGTPWGVMGHHGNPSQGTIVHTLIHAIDNLEMSISLHAFGRGEETGLLRGNP